MTTAVIGTGGIGSAIARRLVSGGESLLLSSADNESARRLAEEIGRGAVVASDKRDALLGADAVVFRTGWAWRRRRSRGGSAEVAARGIHGAECLTEFH